jgi:hypothetical protein
VPVLDPDGGTVPNAEGMQTNAAAAATSKSFFT